MRWITIALCAACWVGCNDEEGGAGVAVVANIDDAGTGSARVDARVNFDGSADATQVQPDVGPGPDASSADAAVDADAAVVDPDGGVAIEDDCTAVCAYLDGCNQCFEDPPGTCLEPEPCAELCRAETPPGAAACIAELVMCDDDAFGACFDANIGDDDCADTCRVLEACEECFTDDDGECLSLAECALVCRDVTPPATAACIAGVSEESCEDIDGCFQ